MLSKAAMKCREYNVRSSMSKPVFEDGRHASAITPLVRDWLFLFMSMRVAAVLALRHSACRPLFRSIWGPFADRYPA